MMEGSLLSTHPSLVKIVAPIVVAVAIAGGGIGYAVHEHSNVRNLAAQKQTLTAQNAQATAQLSATQSEVQVLAAKVDALTQASRTNGGANNENSPAATPASSGTATGRRDAAARASRRQRDDPRFKKLQSQLDAQGKEIDDTRSDLASTRSDLTSTRTELSGSIARTHDELVVLEKKGERNYFEFDLGKTKEFKREGPINISLRKANSKRGYADLALIVEDRNLQQKHVNLYQPAMFYQPESPQPVEVVINDITKDHIHGYVSAPKYRKSELEAMANTNPSAAGAGQAASASQGDNGIVGQAPAPSTDQANTNAQPAPRQKLTLPDQDPNPNQQ
jgi:hypothetical protein